MNTQPYPEGSDSVWLASGRDRHLGAFITAGVGPIPADALSLVQMSIEDIEIRLCQLPQVSQAKLLVSVQRLTISLT